MVMDLIIILHQSMHITTFKANSLRLIFLYSIMTKMKQMLGVGNELTVTMVLELSITLQIDVTVLTV